MGGTTAEDGGAYGSMGGAAAKYNTVAPDLYLGSNISLRPTEGHSFSRPLSNLTNHSFSPQDSIITPSSNCHFLLFT